VGLGVARDAVGRVQTRGVAALNDEERQRYVGDPKRFFEYTETPGFDMFVKRCIDRRFRDRYGDDPDASAAGYLASSMVRDQAVANEAVKLLGERPGTLLVAIVDADRVAFNLGTRGRLAPSKNVASVLVNPTAASTLSKTTRLRLALSDDVTLGYKPPTLADLVVFSQSPPPNLLTHMLNPIDGAFKIDFGLSTGGTATTTSTAA